MLKNPHSVENHPASTVPWRDMLSNQDVGRGEDPAGWSGGDKLKDSVEEPAAGLVHGVEGVVDSIGVQEENHRIIAKLTRHIIPLRMFKNNFMI